MKAKKRQRLEAAGWKIGTAKDFLGLSQEEDAYIRLKLTLARQLKLRRQRRRLTQSDVAKMLGSSQSRVAKLESADRSVSLDLLFRSLLGLGATPHQLTKELAAGWVLKKQGTRRPAKRKTVTRKAAATRRTTKSAARKRPKKERASVPPPR